VLRVPKERCFSTENVGLIYAATKGHEASVLGDPNEFKSHFNCSKFDFCQRATGKQIEIINDHPPREDDEEDETESPDQRSAYHRTQTIQSYLTEEYERARDVNLEFITDRSNNNYPKESLVYRANYETICDSTTLKEAIGLYPGSVPDATRFLANRARNINKQQLFILGDQGAEEAPSGKKCLSFEQMEQERFEKFVKKRIKQEMKKQKKLQDEQAKKNIQLDVICEIDENSESASSMCASSSSVKSKKSHSSWAKISHFFFK